MIMVNNSRVTKQSCDEEISKRWRTLANDYLQLCRRLRGIHLERAR